MMAGMWTPSTGVKIKGPAQNKFAKLPYPSEAGAQKIKDRRQAESDHRAREAKRDRRREAVDESPTAQALHAQSRLAAAYGNRTSTSQSMVPTGPGRVRSTDWQYYGYRPLHKAEGNEPQFLRVEDAGARPSMARGGVGPKSPAAMAGKQFTALDPSPLDSAKHRQTVEATPAGEQIPMPFDAQRIVADKSSVAQKMARQATRPKGGAQHGLWTKVQERKWQAESQKSQRQDTLRKALGL